VIYPSQNKKGYQANYLISFIIRAVMSAVTAAPGYFRSPSLYPTELWAHDLAKKDNKLKCLVIFRLPSCRFSLIRLLKEPGCVKSVQILRNTPPFASLVGTLSQLGFSSKRKSYQPPQQLGNPCAEPELPLSVQAGCPSIMKI
jgi:hypothetical protein